MVRFVALAAMATAAVAVRPTQSPSGLLEKVDKAEASTEASAEEKEVTKEVEKHYEEHHKTIECSAGKQHFEGSASSIKGMKDLEKAKEEFVKKAKEAMEKCEKEMKDGMKEGGHHSGNGTDSHHHRRSSSAHATGFGVAAATTFIGALLM